MATDPSIRRTVEDLRLAAEESPEDDGGRYGVSLIEVGQLADPPEAEVSPYGDNDWHEAWVAARKERQEATASRLERLLIGLSATGLLAITVDSFMACATTICLVVFFSAWRASRWSPTID